MPYVLKLYIYLFVAGVAVTVGAVWLAPLGLIVNIAFALIAAYVWIIVGRRIFNKPDGL